MSEWFCKDCNKDELVDLPNEMHEYLTNYFGNNGRHDSLSAIKIYDFLIEQGLGKVDFISLEYGLVSFPGPIIEHFCNRADLKQQLGMLDEAIDDCNKAITLDMEWSNAYNVVEVRLTTGDTGGITSHDVRLAKRMEHIVQPKRL